MITREERFPTGLDTGNFGIAIPHTDGIHVNKPAIAIAILSKKYRLSKWVVLMKLFKLK